MSSDPHMLLLVSLPPSKEEKEEEEVMTGSPAGGVVQLVKSLLACMKPRVQGQVPTI